MSERGLRCCAVLAALLAGGVAACTALSVPEAPPEPALHDPAWSNDELRAHLRFFNDEVNGRATGTAGFARVAAYVAARMREFRLQPAMDREYRVRYDLPVNQPQAASMRLDGDTLQLYPGLDFLPGVRSDSGSVRVGAFYTEPPTAADRTADTLDYAVLATPDRAGTAALRAWRSAGARAAFVVGRLVPERAAEPVEGLLVAHVTLTAAALALQMDEPALAAALTRDSGERLALPAPLTLDVSTRYAPDAAALNVMGYTAGQDPVRAKDLVVVCSDLDALGQLAGVRIYDFEHFGAGAAALLEVARNFNYVARHRAVPARTVLFALWSGATAEHAGLKAFLDNPTWPLDRIQAVIYVGLDAREAPTVRTMLAARGLRLDVVPPPPDALFPTGYLIDPQQVPRRVRRDRADAATADVDLPAIMLRAVDHAHAMAVNAYALLLHASKADSSLRPALPSIPDALPAGGRE